MTLDFSHPAPLAAPRLNESPLTRLTGSQAIAAGLLGAMPRTTGGQTERSIPELEALANTPLAGLPERAGPKKPAEQAKPKAKAVKPKSTRKVEGA